ncbi:MAG: VOC family protein [Chlorobia bacterium]|nr:VOC family protein [Fimbriimonadaceae bacterium]
MAETMDHSIAVGKTFVWHEVYSPNSEASRDFYMKALGWGTKPMDMGPMGTYHMLTVDGTPVAGCMGTEGNPDMADVPPHWSIYIGVEDVDAKIETCVSLGAVVIVPVMDVPTVGRMALLKDPQGATFWLYKGEG